MAQEIRVDVPYMESVLKTFLRFERGEGVGQARGMMGWYPILVLTGGWVEWGEDGVGMGQELGGWHPVLYLAGVPSPPWWTN